MGVRRILGITFLTGLFLVGIGGGVAFAEFSSFQLEEEKVVGAEFMETNVTREKIASETAKIYVRLDGVERGDVMVETDASMAIDEIEVEGEYNGKALDFYSHMSAENNELHITYYSRGLYEINYMDDILNSIKNKKIPNYREGYLGKHVIRIAPENEARLVILN